NHQPFQLREHIARLYRSLEYIQIDPGLSQDEMCDITLEVVRRNEQNIGPTDDYSIHHRVSRGVGGGVVSNKAQPTVLVYCVPINFESFARSLVEGGNLIVASTRRTPPECLDPKAKLHNKLNHIRAELEGRRVDPAAELVMLDVRGFLSECTSKNVFLVRNGSLYTPKRDYVLEGVTRATILDMAPRLGLPAYETDLTVYDLETADEVFVTSVTPIIIPISRVNSRLLNNEPVPGPVTRRLLSAWSELVGLDIIDQ